MRLSQQTQQLLSTIEDRKDLDWMDVIADLQTTLIKEAIGEDGTEDEIQHGLRPIDSQICYVQSKCNADRMQIADDFIKATGYHVPLLIDSVSLNNPFSN